MGNSTCKNRAECSSDSEDASSVSSTNEKVVVSAGSSEGGSISHQSGEGKVKATFYAEEDGVHDAVDEMNILLKNTPGSPKKVVPAKIVWDGDGENVVVSGSFTGEREIRMVKLDRGFACIRLFSQGGYHYQFIVDGKECCNPNKPIEEDKNGAKHNFMFVQESSLEASIKETSIPESPPGSYSQNIPNFSSDEELGLPPFLPVHLHSQLFLLNQVKSIKEHNVLPGSKYAPVDHLHVQKFAKDIFVFGSTHLYGTKSVTTQFFTPI